MSMIVHELKQAPSLGEGVVQILERTQVGIALGDLIQGMGLLDFSGFGFVGHYDQG